MSNVTVRPAGGTVEEKFQEALQRDAATSPPDFAPPPRQEPVDPDAPHGRGEDGEPLAPYGIGKNKRPRIKPAGPGRRPKPEDEPRVQDGEVATSAASSGGGDYRDDLDGFATTVWMGGCVLPLTRPYAHLFRQASPGMVAAWNEGAKQNATVRGHVRKLSGEGSFGWVIGVIVTTGPFLMGCLELSRKQKDPKLEAKRRQLRAEYSAAAETEFKAFFEDQMAEVRAAAGEQQEAA